ncbi:MAG TPA: hypothetical protein VIM93_11875 [Kangiella sp.]
MSDIANATTWLDYVTAIGAIATPLIVLGMSAIGWSFKQKLEREKELEDKLREDRINTYNEILEPFILLLMTNEAWESDKKNKKRNKDEIATQKLLSLNYRKAGFKLSLVGTDAVVSAYNDLLQLFYNSETTDADVSLDNLYKMMDLLGTFLLQIRKSMGNKSTELDNWQMLEWFLTDARTMKKDYKGK